MIEQGSDHSAVSSRSCIMGAADAIYFFILNSGHALDRDENLVVATSSIEKYDSHMYMDVGGYLSVAIFLHIFEPFAASTITVLCFDTIEKVFNAYLNKLSEKDVESRIRAKVTPQ